MNIRRILIPIVCLLFAAVALTVSPQELRAESVVRLSPSEGDMTLQLREALDNASSDHLRIILDKGVYRFRPDYASQKYCIITNHGNGSKKILFHIQDRKSVSIEGNGAELLLHGQLFPFLFENCSSIRVSDLTIDWDIPFLFQAEIVSCNADEGWRIVKPLKDGYSWSLANDEIVFPGIDGFSYQNLGKTLSFDKDTKDVVFGAQDVNSVPERVVPLKNGNLKIYEKLKYYPPAGTIMVSKGDRDNDRYAPAFDFRESSDIEVRNVTVHHALGMGFLFERCEDIRLLGAEISVTPGSDRVVSTTADASHFANCKGEILVEGCSFQNMLDDGANVHGTYVEIDSVFADGRVRAELKHFEQLGFKFADPGDDVWLICHPSPERACVNRIKSVRVLNEKYMDFTFTSPLPEGLSAGDLLENKTWNPDFTMRNCRIRHHRARNIVLKTPGKILIENNEFSSMMSSVLFRGESFYWYESGAVKDALIRNNRFIDCIKGSTAHSVLLISPRLGHQFEKKGIFDRNIRFIGNVVEGKNPSVVSASRVEGLVIEDNEIVLKKEDRMDMQNIPVFRIIGCKDYRIVGNSVSGNLPQSLSEIDGVRSDVHQACLKRK